MSNLVAENTAAVAGSVGCDADSEAALDCLRNVPFERLTDVSVSFARKMRPPFGELAFYPSYDADYISDRPSVLLRKGAFVKGQLCLSKRLLQEINLMKFRCINYWFMGYQ